MKQKTLLIIMVVTALLMGNCKKDPDDDPLLTSAGLMVFRVAGVRGAEHSPLPAARLSAGVPLQKAKSTPGADTFPITRPKPPGTPT